ncbi:MAG: putative dehydrogenase [Saprospiraceae bacterium]
MKKINFAVIGYGRIGKRHAAIIDGYETAKLVAVCDIKEDKKADVTVPFFNNIKALLNANLPIDVICICTPNGLHAEHALQVLEARKNVVIEKPMALKRADCEAIIFKSLQVSRQVFCVMQNRYSPPAQWLRKVLNNNLLGKIFMVQINCFWNRDDRYYTPDTWHGSKDLDGGTLFTQFSHFIDIMYWLFGDITNIQAVFQNFSHEATIDFEDTGLVHFDFVNGGKGCFNYSTAVFNQNFESTLTIVGEKGTIKVGGQYMEKVEYCHIENYEMPILPPSNPPNDYGAYKGSAANHHYIIENVVDVLNGKTSITTNALEGMKVVDIIERIYLNK